MESHHLALQVSNWLLDLVLKYGYLGAFLLGLVGAMSVLVPVPYTLIVYLLGAFFDPLPLAVSCGLGSAIGELSGYVIGYYGRKAAGAKYQKRLDAILQLFQRHTSLVIFAFALSPLPDDILFIPLGMTRYSVWRALVPCVVGKLMMLYILAYSGKMSYGFIRDIFRGGDWLGTVLTAVGLVVIIAAMLRIDWEKILEKRLEKQAKKIQKSRKNP